MDQYFWAWRDSHRRLFDQWILPLSADPRSLLLWARYSDTCVAEAVPGLGFLDAANVIHASNPFIFHAQWLFFPNLPLFLTVLQLAESASYLDDVFVVFYGLAAMGDVIIFASTLFVMLRGRFNWYEHCTNAANSCMKTVGWSMFCYYILWYFWPKFLSSLWLYFYLYIAAPYSLIRALFDPINAALKLSWKKGAAVDDSSVQNRID